MKTIETTVLEDFGSVDRRRVRKGLLAEPGVHRVIDGPGPHSLSIEYDPEVVGKKLDLILCRHGLCNEVVRPPGGLAGAERTLRDGRRVLIRRIRIDDVERNAAFIEKLSSPSKHYLFLGGISRLSNDALWRLCDPDYAHDMAYVALALEGKDKEPQTQVGVCRYAGANSVKGAEISVAVADDWQHQGLGTLLLQQLIGYARSHGVKRLYSIDSLGNHRMRKLARDLGFSEHRDPDDLHQVMYSLQLGP
jgi:RimJ/RimL family protein N-acetyltransferase